MARKITVESVKALAMDNYDKGASFICECMTDEEIQQLIDDGFTSKKKWLQYIEDYNAHQHEMTQSDTDSVSDSTSTRPQRANRITIQSMGEGKGYEGRFYRTHRLLAKVNSEDTAWERVDGNSTANKESYKAYLIKHAEEYGVIYHPEQQTQAWNRKYNSYTENSQVAEDAVELVSQALDRLADKSRYDMTINNIEMTDIRAKESTLTYVEYGKYTKSGAWCVADIEMTVSVTVNGHEMNMVYNMEMRSGQICKPKTTIAEWNEMVAKEMELNGIEDTTEDKDA